MTGDKYKMSEKCEIGLIILAAGASVRMGKPKQSLEFDGTTLLRRSIQVALNSDCSPVVVVLGARNEILREEIKDCTVSIVINESWQAGMSSSIKTGLKKLIETENQMRGVLIMVCDQPLVSAELLNRITAAHKKTNAPVVASRYADTLGVPALFNRSLFPQLLELKETGGAKKIIKHFENEAVAVLFEEGKFDIDTPDDYLYLINSQNA